MAIVNSSSQASISDGFLRLASEIVRNRQSPEEALRSAVSRAYYSVFLTARDRLFGSDAVGLTSRIRNKLIRRFRHKHGWIPGSHDRIIFAITDLPFSPIIRPLTLSQQISELKEARIHADYYLTNDKLKTIPYDTWLAYTDRMVALASQLLPAARQLPPYPLT